MGVSLDPVSLIDYVFILNNRPQLNVHFGGKTPETIFC